MLFVCYPKCSTCKKAQNLLDEKCISYTLRDIKLDNPTKEEILEWSKKGNLELNKFFNTSGILYRSMNLSSKLKDMNDEEKLTLLESDGMLVKRPILVTDDDVIVGFKKEKYENL